MGATSATSSGSSRYVLANACTTTFLAFLTAVLPCAQLNMGVLFTLGASFTFLARPLPAVCVAVNSAALLTQLFLYLRLRPHAKAFMWELPVKSLSIVTALSGAVLNYLSATMPTGTTGTDADPEGDGEVTHSAVAAMSAATFTLAIALLAVLLVSFVRALASGSYREDLDNSGHRKAPGAVTTRRMSTALRAAKHRRQPGDPRGLRGSGGGPRASIVIETENPMAANPLYQREPPLASSASAQEAAATTKPSRVGNHGRKARGGAHASMPTPVTLRHTLLSRGVSFRPTTIASADGQDADDAGSPTSAGASRRSGGSRAARGRSGTRRHVTHGLGAYKARGRGRRAKGGGRSAGKRDARQ